MPAGWAVDDRAMDDASATAASSERSSCAGRKRHSGPRLSPPRRRQAGPREHVSWLPDAAARRRPSTQAPRRGRRWRHGQLSRNPDPSPTVASRAGARGRLASGRDDLRVPLRSADAVSARPGRWPRAPPPGSPARNTPGPGHRAGRGRRRTGTVGNGPRGSSPCVRRRAWRAHASRRADAPNLARTCTQVFGGPGAARSSSVG